MSRKSRGGLSRGERKIEIALEELDSAEKRWKLAVGGLALVRQKYKCTHPARYYHSGLFIAKCDLCGWDNG